MIRVRNVVCVAHVIYTLKTIRWTSIYPKEFIQMVTLYLLACVCLYAYFIRISVLWKLFLVVDVNLVHVYIWNIETIYDDIFLIIEYFKLIWVNQCCSFLEFLVPYWSEMNFTKIKTNFLQNMKILCRWICWKNSFSLFTIYWIFIFSNTSKSHWVAYYGKWHGSRDEMFNAFIFVPFFPSNQVRF